MRCAADQGRAAKLASTVRFGARGLGVCGDMSYRVREGRVPCVPAPGVGLVRRPMECVFVVPRVRVSQYSSIVSE